MANDTHLLGVVDRAGYGKPGWCSVCAALNKHPELKKPHDRLLFEGVKSTAFNDWLQANLGVQVNRRTFYSHRDHSKNPKDRIVSQVQRQQQQGVIPAHATDEELTDAIVAAALARVAADPSAVTIDQGLKAASLRQQARQSKQGGIAILIATLTKPLDAPLSLALPDGIIEGEAVEVTDDP